jgi:hypothetical protein
MIGGSEFNFNVVVVNQHAVKAMRGKYMFHDMDGLYI